MCSDRSGTSPGPFAGEGGKNQKKFIQQKLCVSQRTGGGGGSIILVEPSANRRQVRMVYRGGGGANQDMESVAWISM